jgi:hypothetical protein
VLGDAEWTQREQRKGRALATCAWIARHRNLLLIGSTGIGKSRLGEAFAKRASTLITSQVPVKGWHDLIGEPTHADAICDRLIHTAYVNLRGDSREETIARVPLRSDERSELQFCRSGGRESPRPPACQKLSGPRARRPLSRRGDSAASRPRTLLSTGPDLCPRCPA